MISKKIKIIGVFVLAISVTISLSACELDDLDDTNGEDQEPNMYELTIEVYGEGTTDPEPNTYEYEKGSIADIEAIPDDNYEFVEWKGNVQESEEAETSILNFRRPKFREIS